MSDKHIILHLWTHGWCHQVHCEWAQDIERCLMSSNMTGVTSKLIACCSRSPFLQTWNLTSFWSKIPMLVLITRNWIPRWPKSKSEYRAHLQTWDLTSFWFKIQMPKSKRLVLITWNWITKYGAHLQTWDLTIILNCQSPSGWYYLIEIESRDDLI